MFGLSFGEIVVLVIVGIVVLGPRRLPEMMRTAGKWVSRLRRMSSDLRKQSGIDDLIKQEGLENEIQELRSLSRINVIDTLMTPAATAGAAAARATVNTPKLEAKVQVPRGQPLRHREYPVIGCDAYGALADDIPPRTPAPPKPAPAPAPAASLPAASDAEANAGETVAKDAAVIEAKDAQAASEAPAASAIAAAAAGAEPAGEAAKESV